MSEKTGDGVEENEVPTIAEREPTLHTLLKTTTASIFYPPHNLHPDEKYTVQRLVPADKPTDPSSIVVYNGTQQEVLIRVDDTTYHNMAVGDSIQFLIYTPPFM